MPFLVDISQLNYFSQQNIEHHLLQLQFECNDQVFSTKEVNATSHTKFLDQFQFEISELSQSFSCSVIVDKTVKGIGKDSIQENSFNIPILSVENNKRIGQIKCFIQVQEIEHQPKNQDLQSSEINELPYEEIQPSNPQVELESSTENQPEIQNEQSIYTVEQHEAVSVKERLNLFSRPLYEINKKEKAPIDHDEDYKPVSNSVFLAWDKKNEEERKQKEEIEKKKELESQQNTLSTSIDIPEENTNIEQVENPVSEENKESTTTQENTKFTTTVEIPQETNTESVDQLKNPLLNTEEKKQNSKLYIIWITIIVIILLAALFLAYWLFFMN